MYFFVSHCEYVCTTCKTISDRYLAGPITVAKQTPGHDLYSIPAAVTVRRASISLCITQDSLMRFMQQHISPSSSPFNWLPSAHVIYPQKQPTEPQHELSPEAEAATVEASQAMMERRSHGKRKS